MTLQSLIDSEPPNGRLELLPGEYFGQVTIDRPITIIGKGMSTWIGSRTGPTIRISAPGVELRDLLVEITIDPEAIAIEAAPGTNPVLDNVLVRGRTSGIPRQNIRQPEVPGKESLKIVYDPPPAIGGPPELESVGPADESSHTSSATAGPAHKAVRVSPGSNRLIVAVIGIIAVAVAVIAAVAMWPILTEKKGPDATDAPRQPLVASLVLKTVPPRVKVHMGSRYLGESGDDNLLLENDVEVGVTHHLKFEKDGFEEKTVSFTIPRSYKGTVYKHDRIRLEKKRDLAKELRERKQELARLKALEEERKRRQREQERLRLLEQERQRQEKEANERFLTMLKQMTTEYYNAMINADQYKLLSLYDFPMQDYFNKSYASRSFVVDDLRRYFGRWRRRSASLRSVSHVHGDRSSGSVRMRVVYDYDFTTRSGRRKRGRSTTDLLWRNTGGTWKIKSTYETVDRYE